MSVIRENKLVPTSGTYLCSMQGYMCRISTLGVKPLPVKMESSCEGCKNGSAWLDMRQARAIWLKQNVRGAGITLNKTGKAHDNAFTTRYKGIPGGYRPA